MVEGSSFPERHRCAGVSRSTTTSGSNGTRRAGRISSGRNLEHCRTAQSAGLLTTRQCRADQISWLKTSPGHPSAQTRHCSDGAAPPGARLAEAEDRDRRHGVPAEFAAHEPILQRHARGELRVTAERASCDTVKPLEDYPPRGIGGTAGATGAAGASGGLCASTERSINPPIHWSTSGPKIA